MLDFIRKLLGQNNEAEIRKLKKIVEKINAMEGDMQKLTDGDIRERVAALRAQAQSGDEPGRPAAGDVRAGARGGGARAGAAAVRRAAHRRDRAASGPHRRDAHRRGQDADGDAAGGAQRAAGQGRAHRHGQRLSGEIPVRMDGQAVPLPRAVGRADRARPRRRRAPAGLRRGHHLRHEQRVRLRLPARQHGHLQGAHGAAAAELRHRRRGRLDPDRRGAHAADHLRARREVHQPVRAGEPVRRPRADRGQGGKGRPAGGRGRLPQGRQGKDDFADGARRAQGRGVLQRRKPHRSAESGAVPPRARRAARPQDDEARRGLHRQGRPGRHRR